MPTTRPGRPSSSSSGSGVTYPIGFDPLPASTTTSYGVYGLPQTFFLNGKHRIVKHVFGALTLSRAP